MNIARVRAVAALDARAHLRSPLLWGLVVVIGFATIAVNPSAMIPSGDAAIGGVQPFSNSRYALAQIFSLTGLIFYTFLTCMLAGSTVIADDECRMGDLLHSTPLTAAEYITGKFAGVMAVLSGVMILHTVMAIAWLEGGHLAGSTNVHGPFRLMHYVGPMLVFVLPGVLFCAGVAFAAGERLRSSLAVYAVPTALFLMTMLGLVPRSASSLDAPLNALFGTFDLWGARWLSRAIFHTDRGVAFYNHAPFVFDATFLLNRAFVLGVPIAAVVASARHFRRTCRGAHGRLSPRAADAAPRDAAPLVSAPLSELRMRMAPPGVVAGALGVARAEWLMLRGQPGIYLFVFFAAMLAWESAGSVRGVFDSAVILTAGGLAVSLVEVLTTIGCLLLMFQLVEALDGPRRLGLHAVLYATPTATTSLVLGTVLAGLALVAVMMAASLGVGVLMLAMQPQGRLTLWPFLLVWSLLLPTFLAWSAVVVAILSLTRSRPLTYVLGLAVLLATIVLVLQGSMTWVWNWPLWGALRWTDLGTLELDRPALLLNRVAILCIAALALATAIRRFPRTEADAVGGSAHTLPHAGIARAFGLTALACLAIAPSVYLAVQVRLGPEGDVARTRSRDYWRRNVETWSGVEPAALTHVDVRVRLEPRLHTMRVDGEFRMTNRSHTAMTQLPFTVGQAFERVAWTVDGQTVPFIDRSDLHVLALSSPLQPGASTRVGFGYSATMPRGLSQNGGGTSEFILPSGVVLNTLGPNFLPLPGFIDGIGVDAASAAEAAEAPKDFWRRELPPIAGNSSAFTSRMEIDAPSDLVVNAVGDKTSERSSAGRTVVVWESGYPVRFLNLVAGRWAVRRDGDTAVFHHPAHADNVAEILETLSAARRRYSEWFHPYPWNALKLSESPDHATRAQGFPTNIPFSEGIGFLTRSHDGSRLPVIVTAHETAHQWWGNLITPGRGPGADVLIEGMAHYSTMLLLEAEHGAQARMDFARSLEARYANQRRVDAEHPLTSIIDTRSPTDDTAAYDKGAWTMWMMQQHLGRDRMLGGLQAFIRRFIDNRDHPALEDLIESLSAYANSPVAFQAFTDQWVRAVVMPEFQLRDVLVSRTAGGWVIAATVENVGTGRMPVTLAATRGRRFAATDAVGYLDARVIAPLGNSRSARVTWTAPFEPERIVVDPDVMVLQLNRDRASLSVDRPGVSRRTP